MSLFRILLMQQKKYKDATHWITVGIDGDGNVKYGYTTTSCGGLVPQDIVINGWEGICTNLYALYKRESYAYLRFSISSKNKVTMTEPSLVQITRLDTGVTASATKSSGKLSDGGKYFNLSSSVNFFTADDLGKTIPLKIEITGSSGSGTTQPAKPDPGLE